MQRTLVLIAVALMSLPALVSAQMAAQPFKLATIEVDGEALIGIVLGDEVIVELNAANAALERGASYPTIPMPENMRDLIGRYDYGMKMRLYEIVNDIVDNNRLAGRNRPSYAHDVDDVRLLPPLMPGKMLNAAVNFYSHVNERGTPAEQQAAADERRRTRGIPYLFIKPTEGAVIGPGDDVVIPWGRHRLDWEVELATVMGRTAKYVSAEDAEDYIFGYMVSLDISDRGGRPPNSRPGSDWLVGKGHDTFAPIGPWIVPKEFYGNPMEILDQVLELDGQVMQRAGPGDMIHSIYELIEYGSSIITMYPGDVLNNGTSGGTGAGRAYRGAQRWLQAGETINASIEGIGSFTLNVVAEEEPPQRTGSYLPPVRSYSDED